MGCAYSRNSPAGTASGSRDQAFRPTTPGRLARLSAGQLSLSAKDGVNALLTPRSQHGSATGNWGGSLYSHQSNDCATSTGQLPGYTALSPRAATHAGHPDPTFDCLPLGLCHKSSSPQQAVRLEDLASHHSSPHAGGGPGAASAVSPTQPWPLAQVLGLSPRGSGPANSLAGTIRTKGGPASDSKSCTNSPAATSTPGTVAAMGMRSGIADSARPTPAASQRTSPATLLALQGSTTGVAAQSSPRTSTRPSPHTSNTAPHPVAVAHHHLMPSDPTSSSCSTPKGAGTWANAHLMSHSAQKPQRVSAPAAGATSGSLLSQSDAGSRPPNRSSAPTSAGQAWARARQALLRNISNHQRPGGAGGELSHESVVMALACAEDDDQLSSSTTTLPVGPQIPFHVISMASHDAFALSNGAPTSCEGTGLTGDMMVVGEAEGVAQLYSHQQGNAGEEEGRATAERHQPFAQGLPSDFEASSPSATSAEGRADSHTHYTMGQVKLTAGVASRSQTTSQHKAPSMTERPLARSMSLVAVQQLASTTHHSGSALSVSALAACTAECDAPPAVIAAPPGVTHAQILQSVDDVALNLESAQMAMQIAVSCGEVVPSRASHAVNSNLGSLVLGAINYEQQALAHQQQVVHMQRPQQGGATTVQSSLESGSASLGGAAYTSNDSRLGTRYSRGSAFASGGGGAGYAGTSITHVTSSVGGVSPIVYQDQQLSRGGRLPSSAEASGAIRTSAPATALRVASSLARSGGGGLGSSEGRLQHTRSSSPSPSLFTRLRNSVSMKAGGTAGLVPHLSTPPPGAAAHQAPHSPVHSPRGSTATRRLTGGQLQLQRRESAGSSSAGGAGVGGSGRYSAGGVGGVPLAMVPLKASMMGTSASLPPPAPLANMVPAGSCTPTCISASQAYGVSPFLAASSSLTGPSGSGGIRVARSTSSHSYTMTATPMSHKDEAEEIALGYFRPSAASGAPARDPTGWLGRSCSTTSATTTLAPVLSGVQGRSDPCGLHDRASAPGPVGVMAPPTALAGVPECPTPPTFTPTGSARVSPVHSAPNLD